MNKYIGKIIIVTNMRKIPRSCAECGYYDGMGNRPGGRYNDGICTAGASIYSTRGIRVTKERWILIIPGYTYVTHRKTRYATNGIAETPAR